MAYEEWVDNCQHAVKDDSKTKPVHFHCNPDEGLRATKEPTQFGFWLPHGIGTKDSAEESFHTIENQYFSRFDAIEEVYVENFGLSEEEILIAK